MKNEKRGCDALRTLFIVIGALVSIGALIAVAYTVFRKYFQITFDCDCDDCDDCFADDDGDYEPICCCEDEGDKCCCDKADDEKKDDAE